MTRTGVPGGSEGEQPGEDLSHDGRLLRLELCLQRPELFYRLTLINICILESRMQTGQYRSHEWVRLRCIMSCRVGKDSLTRIAVSFSTSATTAEARATLANTASSSNVLRPYIVVAIVVAFTAKHECSSVPRKR